jgi:hypothetical protein
LSVLNVEENQVGLVLANAPIDLTQKHILRTMKRDQQKCTKADRQHHRGGLIARTM